MRTVHELLRQAQLWLTEKPEGLGEQQAAWEVAHAVIESAGADELAEAVSELVEAAERESDRDAKNVVAAFGRFHAPGALGNPERQKQIIELYLMFSEDGLWATGANMENAQFRDAVRRMFE